MRLLLVIISIILTGCSMVNYEIDNITYTAKGKNQRVKFIILHYTACNDKISIKTLTKENVSSHYLITTLRWDPIFQLVSENERAWHAGFSSFNGRTNLNDTSIGIEIVNLGFSEVDGELQFYSFEESQIRKTAHLLKKTSKKFNIEPTNILGHSDIAPGRKSDPGPRFPWERLYKEFGIGAWYDHADYNFYYDSAIFDIYSIEDIQSEFKKYGYDMEISGQWNEKEKNVLKAFQMHFRPKNISGQMDLETFAIIKSLNHKYR
ncbi:N-acetylmuramoyl-L-alanine amidase [Ilyobacter polytropus]|uniref:N-acetylmuramoyl-L-alanine amidase n=1 Tax=Ilyobacter polytropus (strain ATCC 51220 / DSM 2926 / LMG 16218 / CuHBu1) TaxID=572544 RepID=E3HD82_ILYPC|nr:N-acetylmuramoyl-L-alanine amidase [Ilyobacter polytropus]ADO84082.1 N-acetylmuramyl-L-alanine amidase, negative regulator of AmpC, AmpD [Ilyobacter polytropus DSM 2926]